MRINLDRMTDYFVDFVGVRIKLDRLITTTR